MLNSQPHPGGIAMTGATTPPAGTDYGEDLRPGDQHYRAYVGPPTQYDVIGGIQVSLLLAAGLRDTHYLADVGCGSLRAGRMLIPYLRPGRYFGIEPNGWLVEEGIRRELGESILEVKRPTFSDAADFSLGSFGVEFDFVVAQSVFSHTHPDLALLGFRGIADALAPDGVLLATFVMGETEEEGEGWVYPECVNYPWDDVKALLSEAGLAGFRVDWMHPRQKWFAASHTEDRGRAIGVANRLRPPVRAV